MALDAVVEEVVLAVAEGVVVVGIARATFQPTTAIAPTVEDWDKVVVSVVHAVDCIVGVDAYVKVTPEGTSDKQSPLTCPGSAFAR